jgi:hypothetical protein
LCRYYAASDAPEIGTGGAKGKQPPGEKIQAKFLHCQNRQTVYRLALVGIAESHIDLDIF